MTTLLRKPIQSAAPKSRQASASFRPALEGLEDRTVPTVTFHGGAVLSHVKVQALFVGSRWASDPALYQQAQYLSGFVNGLVNSSYMDALTNAGYGVGRGTAAPSMIDPSVSAPFIISNVVTADIASRTLQFPDANTLYVCFVQPDVRVNWDNGTTSATVGGFHDAFHLQISGVVTPSRTVRVATIAYPGGTVGNASVPSLSALDSMTVMASREIADAVTDPDGGYKTRGWFDNARNAEIGDINANRIAYVNGYAVQRVVNKDDFVMTPAQAAPVRAANFVLQSNGNLVEITGGASSVLTGAVASVSDQGIDNLGRAVVDVVTTDGHAFEVHDAGGAGAATFTYLGSGVKSAKAGQGVSYVLFTNGDLYEFDDASGLSHFIRGSVQQIDAGTDAQGVNAVDVIVPRQVVASLSVHVAGSGVVVAQPTDAYQYSDDSGAHLLGQGVQSVSAGRQGNSTYVTTTGVAHWHTQSGADVVVGTGVTRATVGTDPNGNAMLDLLFSNGTLREYRPGTGWYTVASGVKDVSKARLGTVDMVLPKSPLVAQSLNRVAIGTVTTVFDVPQAWEHTLSGWRFLSDNATEAV